jgi:hypothetical protein
MRTRVQSPLLVFLAAGLLLLTPMSATAAEVTAEQIQALQAQITALQTELETVKAQAARTAAKQAVQTATAPQSAGSDADKKQGVKLTPGGFVELTAIERSKNETTDMASNFNTAIPFNNSVNAHQSEFRGSARHTRLSLLAEGDVDQDNKLAAYVESDFLGAAPTATSTESNSYNPRLRQAFATYDRKDWGLQVLAGQAWSLLTTNKTGITPRQENLPLVVDAQYVPGFNWTRNPQLRVVKSFDDDKVNVGLSAESPQASLGGITVPGIVNATNTGVSPLNTTAAYSSDLAPDVVLKAAFDPGWGHYEAFGVMRFFHDNVAATFHNNTTIGGGGGVGAVLPVVPKKIDVQLNAMAGPGIGRYGSVQLPDFAFAPDGSLHPLMEYTGLVGIVGHPDPTWDLYLYAGVESTSRFNQASTTFGYGDFALNNSGCLTAGGSCSAQTSNVWQITPGVWKQFYKGNYGMVRVGLQDSITRRNAFSDASGTSPHAIENIAMVSFRYYPF